MSFRLLSGVVARRGSSLVAFALIVGLAAGPVVAEEVTGISEVEFTRRFQDTDPVRALFEARIDGASAEVAAARVRLDPVVSYSREEVFATDEALPENIIQIVWPLDVSGRRSRRIDAASAGVDAVRADADTDAFDRVVDALTVYYDTAYARLRADILREGREQLAGVVEIVRKRVKDEDASGYDLQRLELELGAYDDLIASAKSELASARRRLATLIGEPDALYDASDDLAIPELPASLDDVAAGALEARGDYRAAKHRASQADSELSAAGRAWVPTLMLTGGLKTADLGTETATGFIAGISMSIPLFGRGQEDKARARAAKRLAVGETRVMEWRVPALIRAEYERLDRRNQQARRYAETQLTKLDALLRAAEVSYHEGERGIFELLDVYRTARAVRLRHLELRRETKTNELQLWRALGRRP